MSKIFGIGLSRTGTKSLAAALQILGYNTLHYCPLVNNGEGVSLDDIKKYDAVVSTSFYNMYATLDLQYPNGKFILTTRDEECWFTSISKYSKRWNKEDLGRHENEVKTYFENRNDLLFLEIEHNNSWENLCTFLAKTKPQNSFPHIQ